VYERREDNNAIARVRGRHELDAFSVECNCLVWASILLDLTYQFVAREIQTRGEPIPPIPVLHFTRTMIAIVQDSNAEKAFLVEEWIDTDSDNSERPFIKYLNNRFPQPCLPCSASPKACEIAEFLAFSQHVQWVKSKFLAFTSDYQGAGELLTDPQITSDPYVTRPLSSIVFSAVNLFWYSTSVHGCLFGDGNLLIAFKEFRKNHACNHYCKFFGLRLDISPPSL
jgi:hypothetical protein